MRSPSLEGVFVLAHEAAIDEELLFRLHRLWGGHARTVRGEELPEVAVRLHARMTLRHPDDVSVVIVPPLAPEDKGKAPALSLRLSPVHALRYDAEGDGDIAQLTLDLPVLRAAKLRYATLWAERLDLATPRGTARFLDACRRVRDALGASFAFGASVAELTEPDLVDPRTRAWGVAYYGEAMARELPLDALEGGAQVERDPRGGAWVGLDILPFVDDPDKEAKRRALEERLDLAGRFD